MRRAAVGSKFGAWTVIERIDTNTRKCLCRCGTVRNIHPSNLTSGKTASCGCERGEKIAAKRRTHGAAGTRTYRIWGGMVNRCRNPKNRSFPRYGGVGITVCERWRSFPNFLADMGEAPAGMSIDRIDNAIGYEPANCRWADDLTQRLNRRSVCLTAEIVRDLRAGLISPERAQAITGATCSAIRAAKRGQNWSWV